MTKKTKRIFRQIKKAVFQLAVYSAMLFLVILAVCVFVSIPEIIGALMFG